MTSGNTCLSLLLAITFLVVVWLAVRLIRYVIDRVFSAARMRRSLIEVMQMLASTGIWFAGVLVAVTIAFPSITPAKALTALGLGSVAIGFAFKDIFENFFAGTLLLIREPFRLGDFVQCNDIEGQVQRISIRDTQIRQTDGQMVIVPNAMLLKQPVHVLTNADLRRTTIICGVAYGEDVDKARERSSQPLFVGSTPCATTYATCRFLRRHLAVRRLTSR